MASATKKRTPKKKSLTQAQITTALKKTDDEFLACREAHWWVQIGFFYDANRDIRRVWQCARCKTVKTNKMNAAGEYVAASTYKHPTGYKIGGKVVLASVRAESIRRAKVYTNEQRMLTNTNFNGNATKTATYRVRHQRKTKAKA